jgi:hypothetical protein
VEMWECWEEMAIIDIEEAVPQPMDRVKWKV